MNVLWSPFHVRTPSVTLSGDERGEEMRKAYQAVVGAQFWSTKAAVPVLLALMAAGLAAGITVLAYAGAALDWIL